MVGADVAAAPQEIRGVLLDVGHLNFKSGISNFKRGRALRRRGGADDRTAICAVGPFATLPPASFAPPPAGLSGSNAVGP